MTNAAIEQDAKMDTQLKNDKKSQAREQLKLIKQFETLASKV